MLSVRGVEGWAVPHAATAVIGAAGDRLGAHGDLDRPYPLASVTKLLTAYATLVAVEEGVLALDDAAGPPGSTVRHLLAHASGLDFAARTVRAAPGARRIYSNAGFEVLGETVAARSGIPFPEYVREGVLAPLGMTATAVDGSPAAGATSTVADLAKFAGELQRPVLLDPSTLASATSVAFAGLDGVLPGFGRQSPNDWGLGLELRADKRPHWTGATSSARTFGHFGQSGTFLWVDPDAGVACVVLTDRDFGSWAARAWPEYTDAVLAEVRG
ncbi:serine hydrolase domain-containing protein [Pengzhenrongella sicca]|uniref:Beta-lactamase family protein n=1 Tax=Pengzhenrongella sicca TaxID=2819238 RepID=A0A8A4Z8V0_9MICO|nr:serine hydrolase domain-containing protein [Pengzhenrongella sicca]QTE28302.1 beta-lactamase family protein [Pengzhenrongella sicca]